MKPFALNNLTRSQQIFNYRLSRARRVVENAFGLITSRFRVLNTVIALSPEKVITFVRAICTLHNFLLSFGTERYLRNVPNNPMELRPEMEDLQAHSQEESRQIRIEFEEYFNGEGAVPWQEQI